MPYTIQEKGGEHCVYKEDNDGRPTGESLGCHDTREEAVDQIAAIEASEEKASDVPDDVRYPALYREAIAEAKRRFRVYPSAYANGWMVQEYKRRVRKRHGSNARPYKGEKGLDEWFSEEWVDISRPKDGGGYEPCGRPDTEDMSESEYRSRYPKCLPKSEAAKLTEEERKRLIRRKRDEGLPEGGEPRQTSSDPEKAKFSSITYNGVTVQATGKRSSDRSGKKWERTVRSDGKERVVAWGDPDMEVRADDPESRAAFNARHSCGEKRDPFSAGFWACHDWNDKEKQMNEDTKREVRAIIGGLGSRSDTILDLLGRDTWNSDVASEVEGLLDAELEAVQTARRLLGFGTTKEVKMHGMYGMAEEPEVMVSVVPPGVKSYAELEAREKAGMCERRMGTRLKQYKAMADNIMMDPEMDAKSKMEAMDALSKEMLERMGEAVEEEKGLMARLKERVLEWVRPVSDSDPAPTPGFAVFKDKAGNWRWLAVYSNKFRDRDNPPEILAEDAHRDFVKAVDEGEWPHPELWLWHTPGTRIGEADFVGYDDRGFSIASGGFDEGREMTAERLAKMKGLGVSHGMPPMEIERSADDPTVITRYRTAEISPLPASIAANGLTGFQVLPEGGESMALPQEKKEWLSRVIGNEGVAALDRDVGEKATAAAEERLEFKGDETPAEVPGDAPSGEEESEDGTKEVEPLTRDEVAEGIAGAINSVMGPMLERMEALESEIKALGRSDEDKVKDRVSSVPAASLKDLVLGSVIGRDETWVDGRTSLAKDGPQETEAPKETLSTMRGRRGPDLIQRIASGSNLADALPKNEQQQ